MALFSEHVLAPLFADLAPFERELCELLLRLLNGESTEAARALVETHPVLLVEEAPLFLDIIAKHYQGDAEKDQIVAARRELLLQLREQTGSDDVLFDFVDMGGHLADVQSSSVVDAQWLVGGMEEEIRACLAEGELGQGLQVVVEMHDAYQALPPEEQDAVAERVIAWILFYADVVERALARGELWYRPMIASALPVLHEEFVSTVEDLALDYWGDGDYRQALKLSMFALYLNQHLFGDKNPHTIASYESLAVLWRDLGEYQAALGFATEALHYRYSISSEQDPEVAPTLNIAALANRDAGERDFALELLQRALTIDADPSDMAVSLYLLALLRVDEHEYEAALPPLRRAVEMWRNEIDEYEPDYAASLHLLAAVYWAQGAYADALPLVEEAIELREETAGDDHPDYVSSLTLLAVLQSSLGNYREAVDLFVRAIRAETRAVLRVFPTSSEALRRSYIQKLKAHFHMALSCFVAVHRVNVMDAASLACDLVLRRKGIEAEMSKLFRSRLAARPDRRERLNELQEQLTDIALLGASYEITLEDLPELTYGDYRAQKDTLEMELAAEFAGEAEKALAELLSATGYSHTIAARLAPDEALVELVQYERFDFSAVPADGQPEWLSPGYLAFVIRPDTPHPVSMIELGDAGEIDALVARWRSAVTAEQEPGGNERVSRQLRPSAVGRAARWEDGMTLRERVFDPLLPALEGCTRVRIAPDGALSRLPFEILPTGDGGFLIESYRISYLGTGRDILRTRPSSSAAQPPLVLASPDFDLRDGSPSLQTAPRLPAAHSRDLPRGQLRFGPLPGTEAEGEAIAAMLDVAALLGSSALEGRLKQARSPRILHVATHGFFLPNQAAAPNQVDAFALQIEGSDASWSRISRLEDPLLRSGLALAGANTWLANGNLPPEAEDGLLTAADVTGLDLLATELVVLSACETGLGDVQVGEGVFGLRRAFALAGACTLVMSLWKVPDEQTQELMVDFYRRILARQPCADALREAQLAMKRKYPNPLYWGAFICQGDPGALSAGSDE